MEVTDKLVKKSYGILGLYNKGGDIPFSLVMQMWIEGTL